MGSPLYRSGAGMETKMALHEISRQTMSNWLIKACENWLEPIYEEMKKRLCEHEGTACR
ncbi:IS66 family transposase [Acetivibrio clariflavus]|uniref:IS66 family transposase n=1 Tax=Acetivibrio clariflavus TaxID=288965 RepID=UPI00211E3714|nr:IS66 family transposase [Acetivibrio clariflavus]